MVVCGAIVTLAISTTQHKHGGVDSASPSNAPHTTVAAQKLGQLLPWYTDVTEYVFNGQNLFRG